MSNGDLNIEGIITIMFKNKISILFIVFSAVVCILHAQEQASLVSVIDRLDLKYINRAAPSFPTMKTLLKTPSLVDRLRGALVSLQKQG